MANTNQRLRPEQTGRESDDVISETEVDRLEEITGGADDPELYDDETEENLSELDAETEQEIGALEVNLFQDDAPVARDGSGRIVDDVAEAQVARFTETAPMQVDLGAEPVEPGRDDTSAVLRRHHSPVERSEPIVEGNLDEPRDEEIGERKVDEGTAG